MTGNSKSVVKGYYNCQILLVILYHAIVEHS